MAVGIQELLQNYKDLQDIIAILGMDAVSYTHLSIAWMLFLFAMYALEVLVAFLQAYVFTILSAVYIGLATSDH